MDRKDVLMFGCDYLRGTSAASLEDLCIIPFRYADDWGFYAYNRKLNFGDGLDVLYHTDRPDMKHCMQATGRGMATLQKEGFSFSAIVDYYSKLGLRASRIDIAMDWYPQELINLQDLKSAYEQGAKTPAKSYSLTVERKKGQKESQTFYLGSRKSPAFFRIYDKGIERGLEAKELYRLELQLGSKRAAFAFGKIATDPDTATKTLKALMVGEINRMIPEPPLNWLESAIARLGTESTEILVQRTNPAPEKFANDVILPFLQNNSHLLSGDVLRAIEKECNIALTL